MATTAKITLSAQELQLVTDTGWILTKRNIIDKVYQLLGDLATDMQRMAADEKEWLPAELLNTMPKIYKGENYLGLPYVLMDYPRFFTNDDVFAIRTMFWWGNFFSITLQLSGRYKEMFAERICGRLKFSEQQLYICNSNDPWQHHFEADNYIAVKELDAGKIAKLAADRQFIKLAIPFSIRQWDEMPGLLGRSFISLLQLLKP